MDPDIWYLYRLMLKSRLFEEAVIQLWNDGKISGEMHLAIGEEAISAGIMGQIEEGDAVALDHRGTPQMIMRGIDPKLLLLEFLGSPDGLCGGMGGHMHIFSPRHLITSSGIVGASAPAAVGFALSARYLRPGKIAVAFFGEGAINQGMVLESFNLAASWKLPVLFVCKDNEWAITTASASVTAGNLLERAKSFGIKAREIDGSDVLVVWKTAYEGIQYARQGKGPSYLHMHCFRPEGHFLGDPLIRIARSPVKEMRDLAGPLIKSVSRIRGSSLSKRTKSLGSVTSVLGKTFKQRYFKGNDPLELLAKRIIIHKNRLAELHQEVAKEINVAVTEALQNKAIHSGKTAQ